MGRTVARRIPAYSWVQQKLDRLRPLLGHRPSQAVRLYTIAHLIGDHPTALSLSERGAQRGREQALFVNLVAAWECGDEEGARRRAAGALASGGDGRLRAVSRFFEYVEEPARAQQALDAIDKPDAALLLQLAYSWRRHGQPDRAIALSDRVLALDPDHRRARRTREQAVSDLELIHWEWNGGGHSDRLATESGRVLHMTARSLPHHHAGSTYRTHYTVRAQRESGLDAQVVTQIGFPQGVSGSGFQDSETYREVPYHRVRNGSVSPDRVDELIRRNIAEASRLVRELRPGILHPASDYRNAIVAIELGRRFGIPVVYEVRGFPEEWHPRRPSSRVLYEKFAARRRIEAECWRRADRIVTLAEVMKRHIASKGVDPARITVVPNAVDPDVFAPAPRDDRLAARLGIEGDETVLGYVSTFYPYEGIAYLIEAVARLTGSGHRVRALLVGDGPERAHLGQLAERLKVADRITFTGRLQHELLRDYYGLIDVFVVPRTLEATTRLVTPLKPYEAMAMERAVVVSDTEALREMVIPGQTGLTFGPEDVADLTEVLEELIANPAQRVRLGRQAREWVCANRTWRHNNVLYSDVYADLGARLGGGTPD